MADTQKEFNKDYLAEKLQAVGNKLGDAYGEPLMDELITRIERTVAHFNEEVDVMVIILKSRTKFKRGLFASMRGEKLIAESVELSDLEKKLRLLAMIWACIRSLNRLFKRKFSDIHSKT